MFPNGMATPPVQTGSKLLGDGKATRFSFYHPMAPFVTVSVYRVADGRVTPVDIYQKSGIVEIEFATPPLLGEFMAVVIG